MNVCKNCGANVEGLTHHCDCCGALLCTTTSFWVWHTFATEASGDVYTFMREIFCQFDRIDFSKYDNILQTIEVNVFCYPESMIIEQGIKNRLYFSTVRKKASLTVVLNFDKYIGGSRSEKKELVRVALKAGFMRIRKKASAVGSEIDELLDLVEQSF